MIRRQLPAYSPVHPRALVHAILDLADADVDTPDVLARMLADRYAAERVALTGSGTQALQWALSECRRIRGTEPVVALPAFSCFDLVTAAVGASVRVVFYDVDPTTLAPDAPTLRKALAEGADVVVVANLFAFPVDWDWLRTECEVAGALLVEDAAQGLGCAWGDRPAGSLGDLSVLSFGRGKGWSGGGGGALLARRGLEIDAPSALPALDPHPVTDGAWAFALSMAMWTLGRPNLYRLPTLIPGLGLGETRYRDPQTPGPIPPVDAAIAGRHAAVSFQAVADRKAWGARWNEVAETGDWERHGLKPCTSLEGGTSGFLRFPVLAATEGLRQRLVSRLASFGAVTGYPRLLAELPAARGVLARDPGDLPGARRLVETLFTLPTHSRVTERDLRSVARLVERE